MRKVVVRFSDLVKDNPTLRMSPRYVISRVDAGEIKDYSETLSYRLSQNKYIRKLRSLWKKRD